MTGHTPFAVLRAKMSLQARARSDALAQALRAEMPLHQLRHALALSQAHLAEILRVDQPSISKLERRTDMMVSTLARFIEAMGGHLEVKAVFPTGEVKITGLAKLGREARAMAHEARAEEKEMERAARRRARGRPQPAHKPTAPNP